MRAVLLIRPLHQVRHKPHLRGDKPQNSQHQCSAANDLPTDSLHTSAFPLGYNISAALRSKKMYNSYPLLPMEKETESWRFLVMIPGIFRGWGDHGLNSVSHIYIYIFIHLSKNIVSGFDSKNSLFTWSLGNYLLLDKFCSDCTMLTGG